MKALTVLLLTLLALALALAGCGRDTGSTAAGMGGTEPGGGGGGSDPGPGGGAGARDPFGTTTWQLTAATVDGVPLGLVDTHPITLGVSAAGQLGGVAACNNYGGQYTLDGGTFTFGPVSQTEMACFPEEVQALESAYLAALLRVGTVAADGDELVLAGDGVELRFAGLAPEPSPALAGTTWVLESLISGEAVSSTVAGSTGCNSFSGTITIDGDRLAPAALATTRMACEPGLAAQEAAVLAVLSGGPSWAIDGPVLTLTAPDSGSGLQYRAQPAG